MNRFTSTTIIMMVCLIGMAFTKETSKVVVCNAAGLEKADLCGEKLFFVGKNARLFPNSDASAEKYCSQTSNLVQCVKRYTDKCSLNDIQRNLANVMLYTVRSHHKSVCGSKTKRTQLVTIAKCANSIRKKSSECMNKMLIEFGQALALKESKNRVPYGCCSFHKMKNCIMEVADRAGKDVCSPKAKDTFEQYISSMAGNTLELMCSEYDAESDRCQTVRRLPFNPKKAKTPNSMLKAFGDLLLSEPEKN